ncbi:RagB/SusD family nutrient uptake outer membrane protein [Pontibacter beigongshangensis]|uniref:RagB/SusD family nutrient uptake outer membrane protein n=1 Tax=Pontibacter beigongshangensis TaxID=2574733 RepID=UPI00164F8686|nr:RagB/SusD family nutrient uptake outer membrane protein [Pontibacter beigongshangensis]
MPQKSLISNSIRGDFCRAFERALELTGEKLRWFDLKRRGKLVERMRKYNPDAAPSIQDYHTLRPLPQIEIDVLQNKEEFKQDPGYN